MMEEAEKDKHDNAIPNSKSSVFNKLQPSISQQCSSTFSRMRKDKTPKFSRCRGLWEDKQFKPLVFTKIRIGGKFSSSSPAQDRNSVFNLLGEVNEVQSSIPSRMKHIFTLNIKADDSLKVKRRTHHKKKRRM